MKKILFLIHDLGHGGAEKVLVNLVNNMDTEQFDITVMTLFDEGVNRQFLSPKVTYKFCFSKAIRGNSHLMKLLSPRNLHRWLIKDHYDVEVAYLEGPCARIISGCQTQDTKLVSWIHIQQYTKERAAISFRSYQEAYDCYGRFDRIVCVSEDVKNDFIKQMPVNVTTEVLYNTNETEKILQMAQENVDESVFDSAEVRLVAVGKLLQSKGVDRIARIHKRLRDEGFPVHTYLLGIGPEQKKLEDFAKQNEIEDSFTLLGYQTNPYKYVANCDLFICASHAEGFSTAATEALIVGTPVCTVEVSGMKEMLGENNEWGVVTDNDENSLYVGIKRLLDEPELLTHYRKRAKERGKTFSTEVTVRAVEHMLMTVR